MLTAGETPQPTPALVPHLESAVAAAAQVSSPPQTTSIEETPLFGGVPAPETPATPPLEETTPAAPAVQREEIAAPTAEPVMTDREYVREIVIPEPVTADAVPPAEPIQEVAAVSLQLDWSSGLIQIETDPDKYKEAFARSSEIAPQPPAKRVRPILAPISDEPLVQVETRKKAEITEPEIRQPSLAVPEQPAATSTS